VLRSFVYPTQKAKMLPRLMNYVSFVCSSLLAGAAALPKLDFLFTESPPLFLGISGALLSWAKGARYIFNVSDLWPESAVHVGLIQREGLGFRLAGRLEADLYRRAWLVTGQARTILSDISQRFPHVPTFHLSNGVDTTLFNSALPDRSLERRGKFTIVYAGLHGIAQGLDQLVEAACLLRDSTVHFIFVGDGPTKRTIAELITQRRVSNIELHPPVPHTAVAAVLLAADAVVVPLRSAIPGAVPSKVYEAMAAGKPVLFIGDGEGAQIVTAADAGIVVRPGDVHRIAAALRELAANANLSALLGRNGRAGAVKYDRARIAERFITYLEEELAGRPHAQTAVL
jgi:glycosyltransferase involved in cell wall biosynthesis